MQFIGATAAGLAVAAPAAAQTMNVGDTVTLTTAIDAVNAGTATTIGITQSIALTGVLPPILDGVAIAGNDFTVSGNDTHRVFFVHNGTTSIENLTIADDRAKGGDSFVGGAGGGTDNHAFDVGLRMTR